MVQNANIEETIITTRGIADPHYSEPHTTANRPHPHWGAIFAGIFVALSTLAILAALGGAIGLTTYSATMDVRAWGIGSGLWAILSAIVAFIVGGYIAARASGHTDRKNARFQGMMVWAVTVPLLALLIGSGISRLSVGSTYTELTPNTFTNLSNAHLDVNGNPVPASYPPDDIRRAAIKAAWGTLISLLLGLTAATLGGQLGATGLPLTRRIETTTPVTP